MGVMGITETKREKVEEDVPVVITSANNHDTGSCCHPLSTSENGCGAAAWRPSIRQRNAAAGPRLTLTEGEKHDGDVPLGISSPTFHCTGAAK